MKKIAVLSFVLLLTLACCTWVAAEETEKTEITSGDYTYIVLDDGTAKITRYFGKAEELAIPDELDGIKVTSIGDGAFSFCDSLTGITIPDSVTSIGANPFRYCVQLSEIIVSPDHPYLATIDGVLFSKPDKRLVCYPCSITADSYTIPDGIQIIGDGAFSACSFLTGITIPDSVTSIGNYAFSSCSSLKSITIPDSVTIIGDSAFWGCTSLTSITIPNSVASIGENPFEVCFKLRDIIVSPDQPNLATIDGVLFSKPDKRLVCYPCAFTADSYTVPSGIQIIGGDAFYCCRYLTSIMIPDSVISIGNWTFYDCSSLTAITIPDSVTSIGENAFTINQDYKFILNPGLTATVSRNSYAEQYCRDNNLKYTYAD